MAAGSAKGSGAPSQGNRKPAGNGGKRKKK